MKILGIDPGSNIMGYAIINTNNNVILVEQIGILHLKKIELLEQKLSTIYKKVSDLIEIFNIESLAIEAPFYGKNAQSMLKLGRAQGAAIVSASIMGLSVTEYAPKAIKLAITGSGKATKEQVLAMLKNIVSNTFEIPTLDASDALGVAVCHFLRRNTKGGSSSKSKNWSAFVRNNPDRIIK